MVRAKTAALAMMACLLGMAAGSTPDTLWVKRLDLGADECGYGIALRANAMAATGSAWTGASNDILVARMDRDGDTIWTRTCDAGSDDVGMSVCLDAEQNVFVTGYSLIFKDAGSSFRSRQDAFGRVRGALASDLQEMAYAAKYDSLGERKWLKVDTGYMTAGVATDTDGNLYLSGAFNTGTGYDLWFAKLDTAGNTVWMRTYDLAPLEIGFRLAAEPSGNIAACAYVGDMSDFDCMVLRLTPDGDTLWTRRFNQEQDDGGSAVAVDPSGNIVMVGRCATDMVSDGLVLKYSPSGTLLWQRVVDFNTDDGFLGTSCDSAGGIYVTGYTGFDFPHDCVTMKFDSAGNTVWTATYGGPNEDQAGDVVCDPDGNPIIVGYVTDSLTFGTDLLTLEYAALTGVAEHTCRPVPAVSRTTITAAPYFVLSVPNSGRYDVRLCDLTGGISRQLWHGSLSQGAHRLSLAGLPSGHYFVRVSAPDGGVSCERLVMVK
ncbi:hypothetical protein JXD38_00805 [candidate division WOR-3 bacterium]|nr:hypothetical protein [candidate division WOR-3 bacterium]